MEATIDSYTGSDSPNPSWWLLRRAVEGFNNKVKLAFKKAYGFSEFETAQIALYHQLARLPEPDVTHRFW